VEGNNSCVISQITLELSRCDWRNSRIH